MEKSETNKIEKLIEGLAEVVADGFGDFRDRFEKIDNRLDGIDNRLDGHDEQFKTINYKLDSLIERVDKIDSDIKGIRGALDSFAILDCKNSKTDKFLVSEIKRLDRELRQIKKVLKIS
ncbi:hypothetical protein COT12_03235 [Candidatus Berkelbacteria bacterium CG08_land_8_20_14_0_20_39_8]|uniref:t-SNARE coiled-coil homology domain-containing protein n=1 Tax=Candidatus Berkelbacteria bacterium CG08_land_8_20_14_0_20_39_8 TaxID=1974511 RepID=A0A2M6YBJ0_9BACT|nr:MAG: hypothetical protein COT12_03235 [Candidatus Berkelbacteria bacterium CG08_land_8_20_14_0_20_39_8]